MKTNHFNDLLKAEEVAQRVTALLNELKVSPPYALIALGSLFESVLRTTDTSEVGQAFADVIYQYIRANARNIK